MFAVSAGVPAQPSTISAAGGWSSTLANPIAIETAPDSS
jgi:hypothetical protein